MVRAWYMDASAEDQRAPHMPDPPAFVSLDELREQTGVLYWKLSADDPRADPKLAEIRRERGYTYEDEVNITRDWPQYEQKIKAFYEEHLHTDEEIRLILDGSGYFDCRDRQDKWIRIEMEKGDLIILPAGIYHRFTLDTKDYIRAARYFVGEPVWTPHNRGPQADDMDVRAQYCRQLGAATH